MMRGYRGLLVVLSGLALIVSACSGTTGSTRITPAPTQTERVIVVVVTATAPVTPTTVIVVEPTITPLSTLTPLVSNTVSAATRTPTRPTGGANPTNTTTVNTPRAATATRTLTPAPSPPPSNFIYAAVVALNPKDLRHTNEDLVFEWNFEDGRGLELLGTNECYLLEVTFTDKAANKIRSDSFDNCTYPGSFSIPAGVRARFVLNRPTRQGPNYSSLAPDATQDYDVHWCASVVRKTGTADAAHILFTRLSPSGCLSFPMQGG